MTAPQEHRALPASKIEWANRFAIFPFLSPNIIMDRFLKSEAVVDVVHQLERASLPKVNSTVEAKKESSDDEELL